MTFESVSLLESSLRVLEAGRVSVCKFGRDVQLLADSTALGPQLLSQLTFEQNATDIIKVVYF